MTTLCLACATVGAVMLAGCSQKRGDDMVDVSAAASEAQADIRNYAQIRPLAATDAAVDDVVRGYFAMLSDRRLGQARTAWRDPAAAVAPETLRSGYDRFHAEIGESAERGGNGRKRVVPVTIAATDRDGRPVRLGGEVAVQRADGDGDWRIVAVSLAPVVNGRTANSRTVYDCAGGAILDVRFDGSTNTASVTSEARRWTLTGQPAASGIRYTGEGADLRGEGRDAEWTPSGRNSVRCTAR